MKLILTLLLGLTTSGFAQTAAVTKNPNTNHLTSDLVMPAGRTLLVEGTLQTGQSPVLFGTSIADNWFQPRALVSVLATSPANHGLMTRTTGAAGIAFLGISETGASAGKFIQKQQFSSATLYVARDPVSFPYGNPPTTPVLVVSSPANSSASPIAQFKRDDGATVVLSIGSDGSIVASTAQTTINASNPESLATVAYVNRVGEYVEGTGSEINLIAGAITTVHTLSLSAGDWDVEGTVTYTKAANTVVAYTKQGITMPNTAFGAVGAFTATAAAISSAVPSSFTTPTVRVNISAPTNVFLTTQAGFTTSTLSAIGFISARRVR